MAGIEKVCELSGEYCGWKMYGYKRNHIQVTPKKRKLFRGKEHTLYIFKPEKYWEYPFGGRTQYNKNEMEWFKIPFTSESEYIDYKKTVEKMRLVNQHYFVLDVPELKGEVNGRYMESTYDLTGLKRRLKRMLRVQKLNIVHVDSDYFTWRKNEQQNP